jgi:hypothetical protein
MFLKWILGLLVFTMLEHVYCSGSGHVKTLMLDILANRYISDGVGLTVGILLFAHID